MINRPSGVGPNPISASAHQHVRHTVKARPLAKRVKKEPMSSNEILMLKMKAAGVQPDPDHTESEHYGQS